MQDKYEIGPLLDRIRAGDKSALGILLERIRPYLHLLVRQRCKADVRDKLGDSDIVQEALLRITGGLPVGTQPSGGKFQGAASGVFLAWTAKITNAVVVDLARRGKVRMREKEREMVAAESGPADLRFATPAHAAERAERAVRLAEALNRLPEYKRNVLLLRFFEQLPFEEISRRTGQTVVALRVLCYRALRSLREDEQLVDLMEAGT